MSQLSVADFLHVVSSTPLVSIDLVIQKTNGHVLVGKRIHEPAKDYWFVPGGRICKNECFQDAIVRLCKGELGLQHYTGSYQFLGIYHHIYDKCFYLPNPNITSTHYVCIGIKIILDDHIANTIDISSQHSTYQWMDTASLLANDFVHVNTKKYFLPSMELIIDY